MNGCILRQGNLHSLPDYLPVSCLVTSIDYSHREQGQLLVDTIGAGSILLYLVLHI